MKRLTCAAARRRLHAFYDGELPIGDQIAVAAHLDACAACADALAGVRLVGEALRAATPGSSVLSSDEAASFRVGIVNRVKVERDASLMMRVRGMFEDLHLVYAGLGAAVATSFCIVIMLSMMRFATDERPDSLAAMVAFLAMPGSNANAVALDAESHARWTARFSAANEDAEQETVFALAAVLTREGRIAKLEHLRRRSHADPAGNDAKVVEGLLDALSRARFEAPQADGARPSTGMVWLFTRTTVRATQSSNNLDLPLPAAKKSATSIALGRICA